MIRLITNIFHHVVTIDYRHEFTDVATSRPHADYHVAEYARRQARGASKSGALYDGA